MPRGRILVLWREVTGYLAASIVALVEAGYEVEVLHTGQGTQSPFDVRSLFPPSVKSGQVSWRNDHRRVAQAIDDARPGLVLVASWAVPSYAHALKARPGVLRVLCMDNQWYGTARQRTAVVTARRWLAQRFDGVFVPGLRQAAFALRLGFDADAIQEGLYCADTRAFAEAGDRGQRHAAPREAIFVGRFVKEKGVDLLLDAYGHLSPDAQSKLALTFIGSGPFAEEVASTPGVAIEPFVQPGELPARMARASLLVLPSRFEPWGVVVHEAVAAGLAVVCSNGVGASRQFVISGRNGRVLETVSPVAIAEALERLCHFDDSQWQLMSATSRRIGLSYTQEDWVDNVERLVATL